MTTTTSSPGLDIAAAAELRTLDITVLSGGPSAEREVSLQSGRAIADALGRLGHEVSVADIAADNLKALDRRADIVFIALHGTFGEDGQLQRILEDRGIRFTGSNSASSSLAMNKVESKVRFAEAGIPTPTYHVVTPDDALQVTESWPLPAVVKPVDQGSSVDTYLVKDRAALQDTATIVATRYGQALIERFIDGRELTVGILGDCALPVCEIRTEREFYDYSAKYTDDTTEYLFEFDLPAEVLQRLQMLSLQAHKILGCRDFSRVDWLVDRNDFRPYALEVNTIPGFTSHSLLPKAASRVDISFDQLCQRILELTAQREQ